MSEWISEKLDTDSINGGNQFGTGSNVWTLEEINAFICGIIYAGNDADKAREIAKIASDTATNAVSLASTASQSANEAVDIAEESKAIAKSAENNSIDAQKVSVSAKSIAEITLNKVNGITVSLVENGGELYAEVITNSSGNMEIVLYNTKGDRGDGQIPIYSGFGMNTDGACNQKVVTEKFDSVDNALDNAILVTDEINISGGEA